MKDVAAGIPVWMTTCYLKHMFTCSFIGVQKIQNCTSVHCFNKISAVQDYANRSSIKCICIHTDESMYTYTKLSFIVF